MRVIPIAATLGILAFVTGCAGVGINEPGYGQNYYDGAFEYATQKGEIETVVLGSPFEENSDVVPQVTTNHMKGATPGREVSFKPAPWKATAKEFRVVVLFNGKPPFLAEDLCKNGPELATRSGERPVTMYAAFCHGTHMLSSADGFVGDLAGLQDPQFRELVRGVAYAMIPAVDEDEISNDADIVP